MSKSGLYLNYCLKAFQGQSIYCHMHSEEKQVSLYNELLSLLSTMNAKTSAKYLKEEINICTDTHTQTKIILERILERNIN